MVSGKVLSFLYNRNSLNSIRLKQLLDFRRATFVVWINQVEGKQVVPTDVVFVALNLVAANLTL